MAADMFHHLERLTCKAVHQLVLHLILQFVAELIDDVGWVGDILWHLKLPFASLPQIFARFFQSLGMLFPDLGHLGEDTEGGHARRHIILIASFCHQREEARHHRHRGLNGHHIGVIADTSTGVLVLRVVNILAQLLAQHTQERRL